MKFHGAEIVWDSDLKPYIRALPANGQILTGLDWNTIGTQLPIDGGHCCVISRVRSHRRDFVGPDTFPVISYGGMTSHEAILWGINWLGCWEHDFSGQMD